MFQQFLIFYEVGVLKTVFVSYGCPFGFLKNALKSLKKSFCIPISACMIIFIILIFYILAIIPDGLSINYKTLSTLNLN